MKLHSYFIPLIMDCRSKCKNWNCKTSRRNIEKILCSWIRQTVLKYDTIGTIHKTKKLIKWTSPKLKPSARMMTLLRRERDKPQKGDSACKPYKDLVSRIHKELSIYNHKRKLSLLELAKDLNRNYQRR